MFWCFLVSGGTSLILQGTLTRLLRFVLGNTTLAITTVLCAFLAGLALGSYIGGRLCDRNRRLLRTYGLLEGSAAVFCLLLPVCIEALEPAYRWMYANLQDSPLTLSLARFLLCGALVIGLASGITLGSAAYAEASRFEEAVRVAQDALNLARPSRQMMLAGEIETQLSLYREGKAYHLPER